MADGPPFSGNNDAFARFHALHFGTGCVDGTDGSNMSGPGVFPFNVLSRHVDDAIVDDGRARWYGDGTEGLPGMAVQHEEGTSQNQYQYQYHHQHHTDSMERQDIERQDNRLMGMEVAGSSGCLGEYDAVEDVLDDEGDEGDEGGVEFGFTSEWIERFQKTEKTRCLN